MRRAPNERSSIDVKLANINLSTYSDVRTGSQDLTSMDREKSLPVRRAHYGFTSINKKLDVSAHSNMRHNQREFFPLNKTEPCYPK